VNKRVSTACIIVAAAFLLSAGPAQAFFPFGGFKEDGQLKFMVWRFDMMDQNNDGDVGPDEGITWTFEGEITREFPYMEEDGSISFLEINSGWTEEEQEVLTASFQVWEDIPTSYIAANFTNPVTEIIATRPLTDDSYVVGEGVVALDGINYIKVVDEFDNSLGEELPPGVLGYASLTLALEDTMLNWIGTDSTFLFTGGQIVECDIIISGFYHRPREVEVDLGDGTIVIQEEPPLVDLMSTMVHEIGHAYGMAHTPLNNFSDFLDDSAASGMIGNLEQRVYNVRNSSGALLWIWEMGNTPTAEVIWRQMTSRALHSCTRAVHRRVILLWTIRYGRRPGQGCRHFRCRARTSWRGLMWTAIRLPAASRCSARWQACTSTRNSNRANSA